MRHLLTGLALAASMAMTAGAQMNHAEHKMAAACPLQLTSLGLSAAQQTVFDSIRTEHQAAMKSLMKEHESHPMAAAPGAMMKMSDADRAAMEKSMKLALDAVRAILTPAQLATFNAAVTAHETEMKAMQAKGEHDCMACCMGTGDHSGMKITKPEPLL
jgi:hypothetical protein